MIQKLGARGIKLSERSWDDGSDHDDVTKIFVQGSRQGIASLYINYVKNGKPKDGSIHGFFDYGLTQTVKLIYNADVIVVFLLSLILQFEINHLQNEHLESVDAYYHIKSYDLKAIQFKTNFRTSELMGYTYECTMFTLAVKGKKIIGFHGSDRVQIFSLGAYFTSITPTRLEAKGGMGGKKWDDGFDHEIRKGEVSIVFVKFMYSKDNRVVLGADHGTNTLHGVEEFELDYPSEYITTVEGNYDIVHGSDDLNVILMLRFKTNKRTSPAFGFGKISSFVHHKQGYKIVGFHGISGNMLQQIGVH
ncbi:hypothetical protein CARUB_v10007339mg, partial [Capsella rubella]